MRNKRTIKIFYSSFIIPNSSFCFMSLLHTKKSTPPFYALYAAIFLFSLHVALPLYINSSFLATFVSEKFIGFIYTAEAVVSFFLLLKLPLILTKLGNW